MGSPGDGRCLQRAEGRSTLARAGPCFPRRRSLCLKAEWRMKDTQQGQTRGKGQKSEWGTFPKGLRKSSGGLQQAGQTGYPRTKTLEEKEAGLPSIGVLKAP